MAFRGRIRKRKPILQCKQVQKPLESELNTKGSTKRLLRQKKASSQPYPRRLELSKYQPLNPYRSLQRQVLCKIQHPMAELRKFSYWTVTPILITVSSAERTKYRVTPLEIVRFWPWALAQLSELKDTRYALGQAPEAWWDDLPTSDISIFIGGNEMLRDGNRHVAERTNVDDHARTCRDVLTRDAGTP
jgi:hypothetical protein